MNLLRPVDHSAIRTNQAMIILLLAVAFVLNFPLLAGIVALFMLAGSLLLHKPGFFWLYTQALRPLKLVRPDVVQDHPEPHLFAQGFGGVVVAIATLALFTGLVLPGWILVWLVIALAALNLFGGFCAGCAIYYWLNRLNVPGFAQSPPEGVFPGFRPRR